MIIFKAIRAPKGKKHGRRGSVTHEIHDGLPDRWDNTYPAKEDCYITVSPSASSSGELTLEYLDEVYNEEVNAVGGKHVEPSGLLLDAFRGHYSKEVKARNATDPNLHWLMMDGGITPKCQPLDVLINRVFKGYFRDYFEEWSLSAPINPKTDQPLAPSRQLLAQWVVEAWSKITEELIRKAWVVCGYCQMDALEKDAERTDIVVYTDEALGTMVENIMSDDDNAKMAWIDEANHPEPDFEEEDGDNSSDESENESDSDSESGDDEEDVE